MQKCSPKQQEKTVTVKDIDTVYIASDTVFSSKPRLVAHYNDSGNLKYVSGPNTVDTLYIPYEESIEKINNVKYYSSETNVFEDTLRYNDNFVVVNDTLKNNYITGRSSLFHINKEIITNTTTIEKPIEPKRQVYIGGEVQGNKLRTLDNAQVGLIYKDKKDGIYKANFSINIDGAIGFGVGYYVKIHL